MCWLWIDRQLSLTSFDDTLQRSHVPKMQHQQTNASISYQPNPIHRVQLLLDGYPLDAGLV